MFHVKLRLSSRECIIESKSAGAAFPARALRGARRFNWTAQNYGNDDVDVNFPLFFPRPGLLKFLSSRRSDVTPSPRGEGA